MLARPRVLAHGVFRGAGVRAERARVEFGAVLGGAGDAVAVEARRDKGADGVAAMRVEIESVIN